MNGTMPPLHPILAACPLVGLAYATLAIIASTVAR